MFFCVCYYFSSRMQTDITATTKAPLQLSLLCLQRDLTQKKRVRANCVHKRGPCRDDQGHKDTCNLNKSICKRNDMTNFVMLVTDNFA